MTKYLICLALFSSSLLGCGSAKDESVDAKVKTVPQSITVDSVTWNLSPEMSDGDQQCLLQFFSTHPELSADRIFEARPSVFYSGKNDRRFYWLNTTNIGSDWACMTFQAGQFSFEEGSGSPFKT